MPGVLVPFETREARTERLASSEPENTSLTPEERYARYQQHTLIVCRELLKYYKQSSHWTVDCENEMAIAVNSLRNVCELLVEPITEVSP
tara:strand:- start:243 stop:512 length:270 start_codon:yes stop_codon:yes gene_type:complete